MDALAKELGISSTSLANWVRQSRVDVGEQAGVRSEDRDELVRLRRENRRRELEQVELLDRRSWRTRAELTTAIFDWIEAFYNPTRRHSALGNLSPAQFEALHAATQIAA